MSSGLGLRPTGLSAAAPGGFARARKLLASLSLVAFIRALAMVLVMVQAVVLTRTLGAELFGHFTFAISIGALTLVCASLGMDQVAMREVARVGADNVASTGQWYAVQRNIKKFTMPACLAVATFGGILMIASNGRPKLLMVGGVLAVLPIATARKVIEAINLGAKQTARSMIGTQLVYPLSMAVGVGFALPLGSVDEDLGLVGVYAVAVLVSLLAAWILAGPTRAVLSASKTDIKPTTPVTDQSDESVPGERNMAISGGHLALVSLGFLLGQHIDVLMVGALAGAEDVAMARVASRVAEVAAFSRLIALLHFRPLLIEAHGQSDTPMLQRRSSMMAMLFSATGLPVVTVGFLFSEQVLAFFGPEFEGAVWPLRIYLLGVLAMLLGGPGGALLGFCDQERAASRNLVIAVVSQALALAVLVPNFGVLGASVASAMSLCLLAVMNTFQSRRRLGVDPSVVGVVRSMGGR